jgi:hypothetical protein
MSIVTHAINDRDLIKIIGYEKNKRVDYSFDKEELAVKLPSGYINFQEIYKTQIEEKKLNTSVDASYEALFLTLWSLYGYQCTKVEEMSHSGKSYIYYFIKLNRIPRDYTVKSKGILDIKQKELYYHVFISAINLINVKVDVRSREYDYDKCRLLDHDDV